MQHPKIFVFYNFPVIGEMGEKTIIERTVACSTCERKEMTEKVLSYRFDRWVGEDIVKGSIFYLFSERLKRFFEDSEIEDISFKKIVNEQATHFKIGKSAYKKTLPSFYKIEFQNKLTGPQIWWKMKAVCEVCKDPKWMPTLAGISSMITGDPNETYTPREVHRDSWNGEQLFLLDDPGPPIITEGLLSKINDFTKQKIQLREAKWV